MTALSLCAAVCFLFCGCTNSTPDGSSMWGVDPETHADARSWVFVGTRGFSTAVVASPMIAINPLDDVPYVVYLETAASISVMRYYNSAWEYVGSRGFLAGSFSYLRIAFGSDGLPYIAYKDGASLRTTVRKFDGVSSWSTYGVADFSDGEPSYIDLAVDSANTPYIAYSDQSHSGGSVVVKKYSSGWTDVGTPGFTYSTALYASLAFDSSMYPYVAFEDGAVSNKASVYVDTGADWASVGTPGFSDGIATYVSLVMDGDTPYVGYNDQSLGGATVRRWTGSSWDPVGPPLISPAGADCLTLRIGSNGYPCVAYGDTTTVPPSKAVVKQYTGSEWKIVGDAGFSPASAYELTMDIDSAGVIYVAFRDPPTEFLTVMAFK